MYSFRNFQQTNAPPPTAVCEHVDIDANVVTLSDGIYQWANDTL